MTIRAGTSKDLSAICALQVASWQSAYRGFVTDRFLEDEVPGLLQKHWSQWPGETWRVETAWGQGGLCGFVAVDLAHDGGAYVDNLHVLPTAKGQGTGRALMQAAAKAVIAAGQETLWLTVIDKNTAARGFYTAIGGTEGAAQPEVMHGAPVTALPVTWEANALKSLAGPSSSWS